MDSLVGTSVALLQAVSTVLHIIAHSTYQYIIIVQPVSVHEKLIRLRIDYSSGDVLVSVSLPVQYNYEIKPLLLSEDSDKDIFQEIFFMNRNNVSQRH